MFGLLEMSPTLRNPMFDFGFEEVLPIKKENTKACSENMFWDLTISKVGNVGKDACRKFLVFRLINS